MLAPWEAVKLHGEEEPELCRCNGDMADVVGLAPRLRRCCCSPAVPMHRLPTASGSRLR
ncbi:hypothetical protein GMOD_00004337 [Pyrenophora seminiperda CCB06]|uniref:Uncharacterized protein n=1 Tax=Pyrenophora seminiperda CCB06 TaxID=1302712 RepID=A0A3M7M0V6_9PLEO|nr:hypothetical protein GMOD_00004337 [Pyrenophora seminiperda CCB06]